MHALAWVCANILKASTCPAVENVWYKQGRGRGNQIHEQAVGVCVWWGVGHITAFPAEMCRCVEGICQ